MDGGEMFGVEVFAYFNIICAREPILWRMGPYGAVSNGWVITYNGWFGSVAEGLIDRDGAE